MSEQNGRIVPSCAAQSHHVSTFTFRHAHYELHSPATSANVPRFSLRSTEKPPAGQGDFPVVRTNFLTAGVGRIVHSHELRKPECTIRLFAEPSPTSTLECGRDPKKNPPIDHIAFGYSRGPAIPRCQTFFFLRSNPSAPPR